MKSIDELLAPMQKRLDAATPGPWVVDRPWLARGIMSVDGVMPRNNLHPEAPYEVETIHNHNTRSAAKHIAVPEHGHAADDKSDAANNMEFIAHSRQDLELLIRALKAADICLIEECWCVDCPEGGAICDPCEARREIREILEKV